MSGKMDQSKGRIKEAAGVITEDKRRKREGKLNQVVGKVKATAAQVVEKIRTVLTGNTSPNRTKWRA
jgi:uncharacterized protein YjbJ (UPF0337 family)